MASNMDIDEQLKMSPSYTASDYVDTFKYNRLQLSTILNVNNEYGYLVEIFSQITKNYPNNEQHKYEIMRKLMMGCEGYEHNKQSSIYAIPTSELIHLVYAMQVLTDKYETVELFAGMGLFSNMYETFANKKCESGFPRTQITAYDGDFWSETSNKKKFYNVVEKSIETLLTERHDMNNAICVAIFPHNILGVLVLFLETLTPECLILVIPKDHERRVVDALNETAYKASRFEIKNITYIDYYGLPECEHIQHSVTLVISKYQMIESQISSVIKDILLFDKDICVNVPEQSGDRITVQRIINDYIYSDMFPEWMAYVSHEDKSEILHKLAGSGINQDIVYFIRNNITNMEEFNEYINWKPLKPVRCSKDKFNEYKRIYTRLKTIDDIIYFKENGTFPDWIINIEDAYMYLYLDYTTSIKLWKENENTFRQRVSEL